MSDKKPLYMQVIDKLRERIKSGDFEYDVPFVTEDRITKEFGVSRITAIRALEELEKAGIINRKRGSGSFVSREAVDIIEGRSVSDIRTNSENKDREVLLVALVLPFDIKLGNMFKCFDGINSVLNKENCFASIYNANRDVETEASILRSLLNQGIDGVICYPVNGTKNFEVYNQFLAKKIPLVIIDNYIENMPVSYVASDNFGGTKMLCEYAISKGHKKIGFFSKRRINESLSIRDRYMGYTSALAENNIEVNLDYVCVDLDDKYNMLNETEAARYDSLRAYIAEIIGQMRAEGVTCILCQNDWVVGAAGQRSRKLFGSGLTGHANIFRVEFFYLLQNFIRLAVGRQAEHLIPLSTDDVKALGADGAGRTQQRDFLSHKESTSC